MSDDPRTAALRLCIEALECARPYVPNDIGHGRRTRNEIYKALAAARKALGE